MPVSPFDPYTTKGLELQNRFVMAAAATPFSADEHGIITRDEISRIERIASGGIGFFINGAVTTHPSAQTRPRSCLITTDAGIPQFKKLTDTVHTHGVKIACQLCNSGIWAASYQNSLGKEALGASVVHDGAYAGRPDFPAHFREATEDEIEDIIQGFASSAQRARTAGFDAVEIHGAHDSLFSQFLSPLSNRRDDEWGGSLSNRTRIHRETVRAIKSEVGTDFPVILKIGVQDALPGGLTVQEGVGAAKLCAQAGYDLLEISMGLQGSDLMTESVLLGPIKTIDKEGFTRAWCTAVKKATGISTIMTGGLRSLELIEEILAAKETDLIGLCRPLIREPALVNRWRAGDRRKAACISCNLCLTKPKGTELACVLSEDEGE
ncbi:MAG: NADH:flavin oxidoreductase [Methanoregula sp.]